MHFYRWSVILTVAGIIGGLFLTMLSGLCMNKPFVMDAEIIYFGFPFAWLMAGRSTWMPKNSLWHYIFFWQSFIIDFIIYGLLTTAAIYLYFITITGVGNKVKQRCLISLRHRVNLNTAEGCSK